MEENKKNHFDQVQKFLNQQHKSVEQGINKALLNDILQTAEVIEENNDETKQKEIITDLKDRFKKEDLNQLTDIFNYCQSFFSTNEEPLPLPSQLCISVGKLFTNENLHYTAGKVYSKDEITGGCALSFLVYLAMYEHHTDYVLNFIKGNFEVLSQNKKTECIFQLKQTVPDNEVAKQIIKDSGITEYKLIFSTEVDSTSKPITFRIDNIENNLKTSTQQIRLTETVTSQTENIAESHMANVPESKLPWWKFWSKGK
jgi:hypothetical protein